MENSPTLPLSAPNGPKQGGSSTATDNCRADKSTNKDIYSVQIENGSHLKVFMSSHMHQEMAAINQRPQPFKRPRTGIQANIQGMNTTSESMAAAYADNDPPTKDYPTNESAEIPESVQQYERQLRKMQAATRASTKVSPEDLEIVYNDPHIVVVNKPSGFLTVPGVNDNPNLLSLVYETLQARNEDDRRILQDLEKMEHMIVHRLDMDTSGLVIFAKTKESMAQLQASFREGADQTNTQSKKNRRRKNHKKQPQQGGDDTTNSSSGPPPVTKPIQKEYEALLCGHLTPPSLDTIQIDLPLQRDHQHPPFMRVATPTSEQEAKEVVQGLNHAGWKKIVKKNAKPSQTILRVLSREYLEKNGGNATRSTDGGDHNPTIEGRLPVTRVRLIPVTGRTHQLRVHCAAIGHPILADPTYGIFGEAASNGGFDTNLVDQAFEATGASRASTKLQLELDQWAKHYKQVMCLHARKLELNHPITGEHLSLEVVPKF